MGLPYATIQFPKLLNRETDMPPKETDTLADRWLNTIKNNPLIAGLIVLGTIFGAVVALWDRVEKIYETYFDVPVSLVAFHVASTNGGYIKEAENFTCRFDDVPIRTFEPDDHLKRNSSIPLDFVFSNKSKSDAIFTGVDLVVNWADRVAGGTPGIIVSNQIYPLKIKHQVGTQSFPLTPVYRIPANDTGSFTLEFIPVTEGIGLCWIMHAVFKTSLGSIKTGDFSLIMSNFRR
jgi:hypothetical protein